MSVIVFLGPSLPIDRAREVLPDAKWRPPVKAGDVCRALAHAPSDIAIIDGVYEQVPAVWHKEILFALSEGVRVWGAASMGALRAAELHDFGMRGVGEVFDAYRRGEYSADDEVALIHGPEEFGFRPLSEPLVNIRVGLRRAEARGLISEATHAALLELARGRFYPDRSWLRLRTDGLAAGVPAGEIEALLALVLRERPDIKREDATALLETLAAMSAAIPPRVDCRFDFEATRLWRRMAQDARGPLPVQGHERS